MSTHPALTPGGQTGKTTRISSDRKIDRKIVDNRKIDRYSGLMTIQTITIIRKHVDRFASVDGCSDPRHGLSFGQCRIHRMERYKGKHRADMETLEGFPRMSSL